MENKMMKKIKLAVTILIIALFIWFLVLSPLISFKNYEKQMTEAGEKYYRTYSNELPTGERVKTLTLQDLYYKAFVKEDFYIPYTEKPCDLKASWVKVKKVDGEYKYYTYLKCGVLESTIDHKGPKITLKGEETMKIAKGDTFKEPGIESVIDNTDGKLEVKNVEIRGTVDTSKVGTYEIKYIAFDKMKNRSEAIRKIVVEEQLKNTVKSSTNDLGYYTGANPNNYIRFSNMLFRIIGLDGNNVTLVAEEDIANVDYNGIDKWLDYYYDNLHKNSKKYMVKAKYCNMPLTEETLNTTECSKYTNERYVYIPSAIDINKAEQTGNYLKTKTMSWLANEKDAKTAYLTRYFFYGENDRIYMAYDKTQNYGVRPKITIKGTTHIKDGDGTKSNPYTIGEIPKAKGGENLNTRTTGEYITYSGMLWRIIKTEKDGTTKVICNETLYDEENLVVYNYDSQKSTIYNPKEKGNVGYAINNRAPEFLNTKYFVNHEINVPIYKNKIEYKKEKETKKYKVKLSAPNMYEMFSAMPVGTEDNVQRYWLVNSTKEKFIVGAITDIGVPIDKISIYGRYGVRPVGYLDKNVLITSGKGTEENPYVITK